MSAAAASKIWVAASVGLVEALKDQGFARWNYPIRRLHHHLNSNIPSLSQAKLLYISNGSIEDKSSQSEDSLRKVMFLSSWAPN